MYDVPSFFFNEFNILDLKSMTNFLKNSKIMFWVKKHKYKFVEFDKSQEKNFFNVNTQEEWNTAKNI